MNDFEQMLLYYLWDGQLEIKITGFDMNSFEKILHHELKCRLEAVESIVFQDDDLMSDTEKVEAIKRQFQKEFYNKE